VKCIRQRMLPRFQGSEAAGLVPGLTYQVQVVLDHSALRHVNYLTAIGHHVKRWEG
jgi:hypothetical protein